MALSILMSVFRNFSSDTGVSSIASSVKLLDIVHIERNVKRRNLSLYVAPYQLNSVVLPGTVVAADIPICDRVAPKLHPTQSMDKVCVAYTVQKAQPLALIS